MPIPTFVSNAVRGLTRRSRSTVKGMLAKHGATETDLDRVVRVVWPGPIMKWPREEAHRDVGEGEVLSGESDADRAKENWMARRRTS
jgi:hypothetical protein